MRKIIPICVLMFGLLIACKSQKNAVNQEVTLKVMSYNIHHANPPAFESKIDIDAIVKTIQATDADVVALQEVDVNTQRSGHINEAEILAKKLNMEVFFAKAIDYDGGEYGVAILSKYKITAQKIHRLSMEADAKAEPRVFQTANITIPNYGTIKFGNTHLDVLNTGNRELQAEQIVAIVQKEKLPFVIAGDWNASLDSETLRIMDKAFTRTCTDCPITCPEDGAAGAIDFIAYSKTAKFQTLTYQVDQKNNASDHYPILAEIKLK